MSRIDLSKDMAFEAGRDYEKERKDRGYEPDIFECMADISEELVVADICSCCGDSISEAEDEDYMSELFKQIDYYGMESLTEYQQLLYGVPKIGKWCFNCFEHEGNWKDFYEANGQSIEINDFTQALLDDIEHPHVKCNLCGYDSATFSHDDNQIECPKCLGEE